MCLAIVAPKGTSKNSEFLIKSIKNGAKANGDGMGFAFKRASTKKVYISKGYKDVNSLIEAIDNKKLNDEDELLVHARIGNKGAINDKMCHPFVCSEDEEEILLTDKYVDKPVFIHNGTFAKYSKVGSQYSDTYFFAKNFLSKKPVQNFLKEDPILFKDVMSAHLETSRVAIIFPNCDTEVITFGAFINDEGYLFSNSGYKDPTVRNVGGFQTSFNNRWDSYDVWDDGVEEDYYSRNPTGQSAAVSYTTKTNLFSTTDEDSMDIRPTFAVPDDLTTLSYIEPVSKQRYRYYMGFWVAADSSFLPLRVSPTPLNYHHLNYISRINDVDGGIIFQKKYNMAEFEKDYLNFESSIHFIYAGDVGKPIPVYNEDLNCKFDIRPKNKYKQFYTQYLALVSNLQHSNNQLKKLSKILKNNQDKDHLTYGSISSDGKFDNSHDAVKMVFEREVLELYQFNLILHLYGNRDLAYAKYLEVCF